MRPQNLPTKIFLDSGDPQETEEIISALGFLDGQTTNPSLFAKNPEVIQKIKAGQKFNQQEIYAFYKKIIQKISSLIPAGSVSIEVYADNNTSTDAMVSQGQEMNTWINNAHIKLPITQAGLAAAEILIKKGIKVNMTLCFSQEQGAAVYAATKGALPGDVFLSPFIGRLDDIKQDGMSFIENTVNMFAPSDHHVSVLAASVRTYDHFLQSLKVKADIITAPAKVFKTWAENGMPQPKDDFLYQTAGLNKIIYQNIELNKNWQDYNIQHDLTDQGINKFVADWNKLLK